MKSATIKNFAFANVVGNIIIFIPLGTYLSLFKNNKKVRTAITILSAIGLPVLLYLLFVVKLRL
ncbi:hypothetical protein B4V02_22280 [Paenibacillus kribbensis]|uniref:Uncharacterized protein n=1 Tax=Paenibacillus kribbensis TaxID=172713 RepID=A0A222WU35_9BACL|nr:hypothetical protein B4V02_22280 [Paenibacillus kribbensis]